MKNEFSNKGNLNKSNEGKVNESKANVNKVSTSTNKLLIIAQTTFSLEKFSKYTETIKEMLAKENKDLTIEVRNTICNATKLRQEEAEEISSNVDYMIVIGGKNSANSIKLY